MKVNFHLDKKKKPQSESGMKVVYGQAKRGGYRVRWYLILAVVISPLLIMAYYLAKTHLLVTAPGIVTFYPLTITATQPALVGHLSVSVGSQVSQGQALLSLTDKALDEEVDFIQRELVALSDREVQSVDDLYQVAIANTKQSLSRVKQIQQNYDKFRQKGQVSEVDYAAIVNVSNALNSQLSDQEIAYANAKRDQQQLALAGPISQQYRSLMQELVVKRAQQESLTYVAPFNGRVLDVHVHPGQRVVESAPLLTLAQNITPEITAFLDPRYLDYGKVGEKATVVFPDGQRFSASVSRPIEVVNKLPQELQKSPFQGQPAYIKVTLSFDAPLPKERWIEGVGVEVRF
ncbi:HlyD family secretion protein [Vibrio sp. SM6]|uniref:HlyD family secretion protein n=1 Tax=Vibrio agarilyticus TaxID=2726741 RepID=A0A7X8TQA3_9VIBR|nr:biotin/lipoyl-binding protein [Vibrio agarilyticus]NLS12972.1 HlyD family secretion protein [Vibrio agarilyticus]